MDAKEIVGLESKFVDFLGQFDGCFGRREPREPLRTHVSGELSDLCRKSLEPIALAGDLSPDRLWRGAGVARTHVRPKDGSATAQTPVAR